MKWKKMIAITLSLCVTAGLLSGCSGKEGENRDMESDGKENATGKYVEENVELPLEQNETIFCLLKNANGELEVYTDQEENGGYSKYTSADGEEWKEEDASWMAQIPDGAVVSIAAGADGNHYAVVADGELKMHLFKQTGEKTAEEISIPELNEAGNDPDTKYYSFGTDLYVMENGMIVLAGEDNVNAYNPESGELLHTFPYEKSSTDAANPVSIRGENMAIPSKDNTGFTVWNVEQETEEVSTSYGSDVRSGKIILEDNNEIYFLNAEGIHHMNPGGTLVETLADGGSMMMGTPSAWICGFTKGTAEDFYVLYEVNQSMVLKHYYYDENAKTTQDKKLSIYSLEENDTIRQAVSVFQQQHPDVEVSYKTGESDASTTRADKIRVLNTELLNKSGADVLALDDLPVESFIEKGVLKDISNVINPLIEDGTLQKNIAECYQEKDGKVYGMPIKYGIPVLMGNQEMIDAMGSLDTLENWLDTHEGQKIITQASYGELTRFFVNMYYDELFDKDGKLKEDKLKQCLSCAKRVGELDNAEMENNYVNDETGEKLEDIEGMHLSDWKAGSEIGVIEEPQVCSSELLSTYDMMVPFKFMRENNLPLHFSKDTFVPYGVVGINSASENTELAEEFLKVLFSDEVQNYNLLDGFPVNQNAAAQLKEQGLDSLDAGNEGESLSIVQVGGDDEGNTYDFAMPLKSEIEDFVKRTEELKQPAKADCVLQEMIMEEAKAYYEGSQELEQAIQAIKAKVDTYRSE